MQLYQIDGKLVPHFIVRCNGVQPLHFVTWLGAITWARYLYGCGHTDVTMPRAILRWN